MKVQVKGILLAGAIWAALLVMAKSASAQDDSSDLISRSFDVGYGGTLTVDTDRGSIDVKTARAERVEVEITRDIWPGLFVDDEEILADFEIEFRHDGDDVYLYCDYKREWGGWFWDGAQLRVNFTITVPEEYNLDLTTSGGSIEVADLQGEVECETSGGSLHFQQITGSVYGRTSGGSITLVSSDGSADIKTSGGGIRIGDVTGRVNAHTSGGSIDITRAGDEVEVSTSGGSIYVDEVRGAINASTSGGSIAAYIARQPERDCSLKTSGGSVTVRLADGVKVDINAKTSGGRIWCELPILVNGVVGRNEIDGEINGGGPELYLRSSGGSVQILSM